MKKTANLAALLLGLFLLLVCVFNYGFYRGYNRASRIACAFDLVTDEAMYGDLKKNQTDGVRSFLETGIYADSKFLHRMDEAPFSCFLYELSHSKAGDTAKSVQQADEIIARDNLALKFSAFTPTPKAPSSPAAVTNH